jgi:hypothetical protein
VKSERLDGDKELAGQRSDQVGDCGWSPSSAQVSAKRGLFGFAVLMWARARTAAGYGHPLALAAGRRYLWRTSISLTIGFSLVCRHRDPVTERPTIGLTLTNRPSLCRLNLMTDGTGGEQRHAGSAQRGGEAPGRRPSGPAHTLARDRFSGDDAQAHSSRAYRARA